MSAPGFRTGFVSILGRPNAGKSTLLNALLGAKLAIVAPKAQTTRTSIQGVLNLPEAQVIFLDTPGIHRSDSLFNRRMMDTIRVALEDRDLLLYLADATLQPNADDERAISVMNKSEAPVYLVLTKIDRVPDKRNLLARIEQFKAIREFAEYIPVSAVNGNGLEDLKRSILARLPEGEPMFPPDYITDQPERYLVAELVREKILRMTQQEVPHSVAVLVEKWEETGGLTRIYCTIYVERSGQKSIIIGKGGAVLKKIGTGARIEAEQLLERKIYLELFVKVREKWREDPAFLNEIDWRSMAGR
jgi:GTP-binding protein Era